MIGDSIEADVRGALNFGMDAIYFNPNNTLPPEDIKHHINHLQELFNIL
jgi:putative hydrolase of the HAD superfamily